MIGVAGNAQLARELMATVATLNANHNLRLFVNDVTPTPAMTAATFVEASFPGYVPVNLNNQWMVPMMEEDGKIVTMTGPHDFERTATGVTQLAYGAYVTDLSLSPVLAARFELPISFTNDGDTWQVAANYYAVSPCIILVE